MVKSSFVNLASTMFYDFFCTLKFNPELLQFQHIDIYDDMMCFDFSPWPRTWDFSFFSTHS